MFSIRSTDRNQNKHYSSGFFTTESKETLKELKNSGLDSFPYKLIELRKIEPEETLSFIDSLSQSKIEGIRFVGYSAQIVHQLCKAIVNLRRRLKFISFEQCSIYPQTIQELSIAGDFSLELRRIVIDESFSKILGSASLNQLYVDGCSLTEASLKLLCEGIGKSKLQGVGMSHISGLTDETLIFVADAIHESPYLKFINLSQNDLSDKVAIPLITRALQTHHPIFINIDCSLESSIKLKKIMQSLNSEKAKLFTALISVYLYRQGRNSPLRYLPLSLMKILAEMVG